LGFVQKLGANGGALALTVNSINLGTITRTTSDNPDGELGEFRVGMTTIGVSFAKQFTDHIYVGTSLRVASVNTAQVGASALSVDAGLQYRTGTKDRVKFGIALRNVGPTTKFSGQGLDNRVYIRSVNNYTSSNSIPSETYELPTCLSIGGSYDFFLGEENAFTLMGTFISNGFYYSQFGVGAQLRYKQYFMARAGYVYEKGVLGAFGVERYSAYSGPAAGITLQLPFETGKTNSEGDPTYSNLGIDVSYRLTNPYGGTFGIGLRLDL